MKYDIILNECKEKITNLININKKINEKQILLVAKDIYDIYKKKYKDIKLGDIITIIKCCFTVKYKQNDKVIDTRCVRDCEFLFDKIKIPSEFKKSLDHFEKLRNLYQPVQKSKEWFEYRHNRITASDVGEAIDLNPYSCVENFIIKKSDPSFKFLDNENVYHGKKYEQIATSIYEYIYNNKVVEFGALPSDKYDLLGASPDGICSSQSLDYKFSPLLGTMLEIKCVVKRTIYTSGKIVGHICPFYYYCQVQQQLECCDLDKCDFWQCKITEYKSRNAYLVDECTNTLHTVGINSEEVIIDNRIKKGVLLKFLPKIWSEEFNGDLIDWKSKFIYPPNLLMCENEYDTWIAETMTNWHNTYPDIAETHYFEKVVYWKLDLSHNVTIKRDINFFQSILPILNQTWERVIYYRNNIDKLQELKDIAAKRTKYIKFDTTIKINNDIISKKIKFLDYSSKIKELKIKSFEDDQFLD